MPDPALVRQAGQYLIRGCFSLVADEIRGQARRKLAPEPPSAEALAAPMEFPDFPSLDDARLGDSLAPGEALAGADVPDDLFSCVVGLEYERRVLHRVVSSEVPLHAVLVGPPGSAKSLLLEELRRLPDTRYIVGRNMTSSGLLEMFVEQPDPPRILLIDEIEKSDPTTLATLLTIMDGKATRAVHGKAAVEQSVDVRVVAAGNSMHGVPPALRSRFIELDLADYSPAESRAVIGSMLAGRHGVEKARAEEIAERVAAKGGDTRDAVQVAQMWDQDEATAKDMIERLGNRTTTAPTPHQRRTTPAPA